MMWLWVFVGRCRWFWVVMKWFRLVVGGFGWLWVVLGRCGWFWVVVDGFGWLWMVLGGCGWFWVVPRFSKYVSYTHFKTANELKMYSFTLS